MTPAELLPALFALFLRVLRGGAATPGQGDAIVAYAQAHRARVMKSLEPLAVAVRKKHASLDYGMVSYERFPVKETASLAKVRQAIREEDEEYLAAFGPTGQMVVQSGPAVTRSLGYDPRKHCAVSREGSEKLRNTPGSYFVHNHPSGNPTLSAADLKLLIITGGSGIEAVAKGTGTICRALRTADEISREDILVYEVALRAAGDRARRRMDAHIAGGGRYEEDLWRAYVREEQERAFQSCVDGTEGYTFRTLWFSLERDRAGRAVNAAGVRAGRRGQDGRPEQGEALAAEPGAAGAAVGSRRRDR